MLKDRANALSNSDRTAQFYISSYIYKPMARYVDTDAFLKVFGYLLFNIYYLFAGWLLVFLNAGLLYVRLGVFGEG